MDLRNVFLSLKPGDLLMGQCREGCGDFHNHVVLATGKDEKGAFMSISEEGRDLHLPSELNPLRWSEERNRVVDGEGDVVPWFTSDDLQYERGACMEVVEKYRTLPRSEDLTRRFTDSEVTSYTDSPEGKALVERIQLIFRNNEITSSVDELCLVLKTLGIDPTPANITGIVTTAGWLAGRHHSALTVAVLVTGERHPKDVPPPSPTCH